MRRLGVGRGDASSDEAGGCGCGGSTLSRGRAPATTTTTTTATATTADDGAVGDGAAIWVPGGEFVMGHDNRSLSPSTFDADGEGPSRRVAVDGFWMAETEVSNAQFAAFAAATGHVTDSERFNWSFVFERQLTAAANAAATQSVHAAPWWMRRRRELARAGRAGVGRARRRARCAPGGARLVDRRGGVLRLGPPGGRAAADGGRVGAGGARRRRGGAEAVAVPVGRRAHAGRRTRNVWQGKFPLNHGEGRVGAHGAVRSMEPQNALGFHHLIGNVWEWVSTTGRRATPSRRAAPPLQNRAARRARRRRASARRALVHVPQVVLLPVPHRRALAKLRGHGHVQPRHPMRRERR